MIIDPSQDISAMVEADKTMYYITTSEWDEEPPDKFVKWLGQVCEKFPIESGSFASNYPSGIFKLLRAGDTGIPKPAGLRRLSMSELLALQEKAHEEYKRREPEIDPFARDAVAF